MLSKLAYAWEINSVDLFLTCNLSPEIKKKKNLSPLEMLILLGLTCYWLALVGINEQLLKLP